jgi:hypothetical protein
MIIGYIFFTKNKYKQSIITWAFIPGYWILSMVAIILVQVILVTQNELEKEKPYIQNNMINTKLGYNLNITESEFPVSNNLTPEILKKNDVACMIGNDGLGANITRDYLNIVFAMKNRLGSPVRFGTDDLVYMIDNGYEYIGRMLNIKIGRIEKGYKADMVAVPYIPPTPMDEGNVIGHIFFGVFDNFHPRNVWAGGKCLMKDYNMGFDTDSIYIDSKIQARLVWDRIGK